MTIVAITGNTYPVKEQLKALGARWDGGNKAWMIDADKADQARAIVADAGPVQPRSFSTGSSPYRPRTCKSCGCAGSRYNPIYRSGQCKDCWLGDKEEREMGY